MHSHQGKFAQSHMFSARLEVLVSLSVSDSISTGRDSTSLLKTSLNGNRKAAGRNAHLGALFFAACSLVHTQKLGS